MIMEIVCQVASTLLPGSTYITIVRDPIDLFESLWSYASKQASVSSLVVG